MFTRRLKTGYFVLEGLNSMATVYYFYYFYFYMHHQFGFGNKANLLLAAANGATYALASWWAGKFAQRFGYFRALKVGFFSMMVPLAVGSQLNSAAGEIVVMLSTVVGMSFTWPTLEALVSEGESTAGVQHMVGVYNVVWAATAALSNFCGGAMLEKLGFRSLFFVPIGIEVCQLTLTFWLQAQARRNDALRNREVSPTGAAASRFGSREPGAPLSPASPLPFSGEAVALATQPVLRTLDGRETSRKRTKTFLRMAWLANPFAYIAINTLIAVMPGVAENLKLSTMLAGFCGSTWCFARLGAFALLWRWTAWHYRFRWMLGAFIALVISFVTILLIPSLAGVIAAEVLFGGAVGLLYYSSLFYSMDSSETKGEHGGIHEAVIGLGNCAGPTVGALALQFLPGVSHSGALAVGLLLLGGLGGLLAIWRTGEKQARVHE